MIEVLGSFSKKKSRTALDVLTDGSAQNFSIGIQDFDRGYDVWDQHRINAKGDLDPGWVYQPNISKECVVCFTVNEGKGTGKQIIPVSEFEQYVSVLENIIKTDYNCDNEEDRSIYKPTYMIAKASFSMNHPKEFYFDKDGKEKARQAFDKPKSVVSIRTRGGQGAKPIMVEKEEFPKIVELLRSTVSKLPELEKVAWEVYNNANKKLEPLAHNDVFGNSQHHIDMEDVNDEDNEY